MVHRPGRNNQPGSRTYKLIAFQGDVYCSAIYILDSSRPLHTEAIECPAFSIIVSSYIRLSASANNAGLLTESVTLLAEECITGVIEVHMFSL